MGTRGLDGPRRIKRASPDYTGVYEELGILPLSWKLFMLLGAGYGGTSPAPRARYSQTKTCEQVTTPRLHINVTVSLFPCRKELQGVGYKTNTLRLK